MAINPHCAFPVADNCLQVGGMSLTRLAERVGRTPFYVYDRQLIEARVAALRAALPTGIGLHYAIKANPMPDLVKHLAGLVDGFDIASGGEMAVALASAMAPEKVSFAGPGKSEAELRQAVDAGVVVSIESARELDVLSRLARESGRSPPVMLRINPDFELKTAGMKMGGGAKPFGVDAEQAPELLARLAASPLDFRGLHIYAGSQNLRAEAIAESFEQTLDLARRLASQAPGPIRVLNLGGGFGIPYFAGEAPLDLAAVGARLAGMLPAARRDFPQAEFILELGRYLVGEAGLYVCRVIDRKFSRGQLFLVTDGGLHHHLAASGNLGQVLRKNFPVLVGNRVAADAGGIATVVGPLCTPLDILADRAPLGHARIGDLIAVAQSGAYGLSASPTHFLSHPEPAEVLI